MGFSLPDMWVWDAWYYTHGDLTHMFFLKAPKSVGDPDQRHFYASVGHATSTDFVTWDYHGTAIAPSEGPAWDDMTIWTGCVVENPQGGFVLFYTGTSRADRAHVQRIGAATSDDLFNWTRVGTEPALEADPNFYGKLGDEGVADEACRDPWVFQVEGDARWHMLFTAYGKHDVLKENGVIGYAVSDDLFTWTQQPAMFDTKIGQELEVPETFEVNGTWYLAFSRWSWGAPKSHEDAIGHKIASGTYYLRSEEGPLGPWTLTDTKGLLTDSDEKIYVARKVTLPDGRDALIAFNNSDGNGSFPGTLTDPIAFDQDEDGRLILAAPNSNMKSA